MANVPLPKEKWTGSIGELELGNPQDKGGSRRPVKLGGNRGMPFLSFEDGERRMIAMAGLVADSLEDVPQPVRDAFGDDAEDPVRWARAWAARGADLICLRLTSTNPEEGDASPESAADTVMAVLKAVDLPLIVYGSGHEEKDSKVLEKVGERARGERLLLGHAEESAYKSVAAAAMANGHAVIGFSNLDINLAKQIVILLTDFGVGKGDIMIDPLMAALGMGLEYSYSVNERIRISALSGDSMLRVPMICDCTSAWKAREATDDVPHAGDTLERGIWWEATTALAALLSGADVLVLGHPEAMELARTAVSDLGGED
ncbi:MAG TPA: acetyl-CoA decarbonylase/synthase complex subunit delta [Methanomassiliicoccales archaeon]|nr:acetyl-CoA decarbonylase/synthase complex subunit delta [Methanomassiliicoccales archaeon]